MHTILDTPHPDWDFGYFKHTGGATIRFGSYVPDNPAGTVFFGPGLNRSIEYYFPLLHLMAAHGMAAYSLDWEGQGGSEGRLHDGRYFARQAKLAEHFISNYISPDPGAPFILAGHSAGAHYLMRYLKDHAPQNGIEPDSAIWAAPLLGLPPYARASRWLSDRIAPEKQVPGFLDIVPNIMESASETVDRIRSGANKALPLNSLSTLFRKAGWEDAIPHRVLCLLQDFLQAAAPENPSPSFCEAFQRVHGQENIHERGKPWMPLFGWLKEAHVSCADLRGATAFWETLPPSLMFTAEKDGKVCTRTQKDLAAQISQITQHMVPGKHSILYDVPPEVLAGIYDEIDRRLAQQLGTAPVMENTRLADLLSASGQGSSSPPDWRTNHPGASAPPPRKLAAA